MRRETRAAFRSASNTARGRSFASRSKPSWRPLYQRYRLSSLRRVLDVFHDSSAMEGYRVRQPFPHGRVIAQPHALLTREPGFYLPRRNTRSDSIGGHPARRKCLPENTWRAAGSGEGLVDAATGTARRVVARKISNRSAGSKRYRVDHRPRQYRSAGVAASPRRVPGNPDFSRVDGPVWTDVFPPRRTQSAALPSARAVGRDGRLSSKSRRGAVERDPDCAGIAPFGIAGFQPSAVG